MHKYKALVAVISCFLFFSSLIIVITSEQSIAEAKDIYVDDDQRYPNEADGTLLNPYAKIQDAINGATEGDTIKVLKGSYGEDLVIDKSVTITSEDRTATMIMSTSLNRYVIDITAESVSLEGFTIFDNTTTSHRKAVVHVSEGANGAKIIDNNINDSTNGYGIEVDTSDNIILRNNTLNNTRGINVMYCDFVTIDSNYLGNCSKIINDVETPYSCVRLFYSNKNHILKNNLTTSTNGVYSLYSSENSIFNNTIESHSNNGIKITGGEKNNIENNTIYNNSVAGLDIDCSQGVVFGNTIGYCGMGIVLWGNGYEFKDNKILYSFTYGVFARTGSYNNIFVNNTFLINNIHAVDQSDNQWDNGIIGNYWDDFYGPDPNNLNNTVAYNSQVIPSVYKYVGNGFVDSYPTGAYHTQATIADPSPTNLQERVSRSPRLVLFVEDPDPVLYRGRLDVYFYYIYEGEKNLIGVDTNVESGGNASVWFSSKIEGKQSAYSYGGLGYDYIGVWFVEVVDYYHGGNSITLSRNTSPAWVFSTMNTPVNNKKPTIKIKAQNEFMIANEIHAQIGDEIQFDASECNDSDGEIVFYKWTFGEDETCVINEVSPKYTYEKKEGTFIANLVVIDDNGSSNSSDITVIISSNVNRAPTAVISAPSTGYVSDSISFIGSGSNDPDSGDSIIAYYWDFDGQSTSTDADTTHKFSKAGIYTIMLTVTDSHRVNGTAVVEILIKSKSGGGSPGFELLLVILALIPIVFIRKRKK